MPERTIKICVSLLIVLLAAANVAVRFHVARASKRQEAARKPPAAEEPPVDVAVRMVRLEPEVRDILELPAVVEANRIIKVSAEVSGRAERVPFEEGARVKAGQLLIELNKDLLQAAYDRALADEKYARDHAEKMVHLSERGVVPPDRRDQALAAKDVARAVLASARARLERATILSPTDAVLNRMLVEEGEYVDSGEAVAELVDVETAKVVVHVPERDVRFFRADPGAEAEVHTGQGNPVVGTITYISELADAHTHTTRMEITVRNNPRIVRTGQIVTVRLERRIIKDAIMVPLDSVIPMESGHVVYVVEPFDKLRAPSDVEGDGVAVRRRVRLGLRRGQMVLIEPCDGAHGPEPVEGEGLKQGDRLIVAGHRFVGPGQPVNVVAGRGGEAEPFLIFDF